MKSYISEWERKSTKIKSPYQILYYSVNNGKQKRLLY